MSAIKYLSDTQPHLILHVWVPDYFKDLAKHLCPNLDIKNFTQAQTQYNPKYAGRATDESMHTLMASHLVDQAFHVVVDQQVDVKYKNYIPLKLNTIPIKKYNLPEKYVVVTTGFTADVREMLPEVVNKLTDYAIDKGYKVVFLGKKQTATGSNHVIKGTFKQEIDYKKGINLIDRTTLLEAGKILAGAKCVVGLDNGLMHLAACSDVAIVGGFTTVKPEHRAPIRHNKYGWNFYPVTPKKLSCFGCQSNWSHVYNHDFRNCFYKQNGYDTEIKCVKQLTADLYIKELEKIL